jgi:hypothetical protein
MAARGLDVVYEAEVEDWRRVRFAVVWCAKRKRGAGGGLARARRVRV